MITFSDIEHIIQTKEFKENIAVVDPDNELWKRIVQDPYAFSFDGYKSMYTDKVSALVIKYKARSTAADGSYENLAWWCDSDDAQVQFRSLYLQIKRRYKEGLKNLYSRYLLLLIADSTSKVLEAKRVYKTEAKKLVRAETLFKNKKTQIAPRIDQIFNGIVAQYNSYVNRVNNDIWHNKVLSFSFLVRDILIGMGGTSETLVWDWLSGTLTYTNPDTGDEEPYVFWSPNYEIPAEDSIVLYDGDGAERGIFDYDQTSWFPSAILDIISEDAFSNMREPIASETLVVEDVVLPCRTAFLDVMEEFDCISGISTILEELTELLEEAMSRTNAVDLSEYQFIYSRLSSKYVLPKLQGISLLETSFIGVRFPIYEQFRNLRSVIKIYNENLLLLYDGYLATAVSDADNIWSLIFTYYSNYGPIIDGAHVGYSWDGPNSVRTEISIGSATEYKDIHDIVARIESEMADMPSNTPEERDVRREFYYTEVEETYSHQETRELLRVQEQLVSKWYTELSAIIVSFNTVMHYERILKALFTQMELLRAYTEDTLVEFSDTLNFTFLETSILRYRNAIDVLQELYEKEAEVKTLVYEQEELEKLEIAKLASEVVLAKKLVLEYKATSVPDTTKFRGLRWTVGEGKILEEFEMKYKAIFVKGPTL